MSYIDKDFISKWMKRNIVEKNPEIVELTYVGPTSGKDYGGCKIYKSIDLPEFSDKCSIFNRTKVFHLSFFEGRRM